MDRRHLIGGLFWLAFSLFIGFNALDLGLGTFTKPGPGFIFFWSSMGLGILSFILVIKSIFKKKDVTPLGDSWKGLKWGNALLAIVALFFYALLLDILGYLIATFLLMIVLFGIGRPRYWVAVGSALLTSLLSFVIFKNLLEVHLPRGLFGW